jgi:endonuclease YncB( thermonuclease family)
MTTQPPTPPFHSPPFSLAGTKCIGRVVAVHDGDTLKIVLNPFDKNKYFAFSCRLAGIDTPEITSDHPTTRYMANRARQRLCELCCFSRSSGGYVDDETNTHFSDKKSIESYFRLQRSGSTNAVLVNVECLGFEKYGRLLVVLRDVGSDPNNDESFNDILIREGHAAKYSVR